MARMLIIVNYIIIQYLIDVLCIFKKLYNQYIVILFMAIYSYRETKHNPKVPAEIKPFAKACAILPPPIKPIFKSLLAIITYYKSKILKRSL